ncbi:MAG: XAC2610-related protein [Pyrinomonadaceae bacterium]
MPRKNKVEVFNYKKAKGNVAVIKFYALTANKKWKLKQNFEFEKDDLTECNPKISDFNNDGFKDLTYISNIAARGANQVRRLFIYNKKKDELILMKNSEDYPNMLYNKTLNCIDSFLVHGTSATLFLKIEGDRLKEFAGVGNDGFVRVAYLIGKNGKEKILRKHKITEDEIYVRYRTFNPPRSYTVKELNQ